MLKKLEEVTTINNEAMKQLAAASAAFEASCPPSFLAEPNAHALADRALAGYAAGEATFGGGSFNAAALSIVGAALLTRRKWQKQKRAPRHQLFVNRNTIPALQETLLVSLISDDVKFKESTRMTRQQFDELVETLRPSMEHQRTRIDNVDVETQVLTSIYHMAHGSSLRSLVPVFRISHASLHRFYVKTIDAIIKHVAPVHLKFPTTQQEWQSIADRFYERWQWPNCVGAIDGKHVRIEDHPGAGSLNFNYKQYHSLLLIAMVDADYRLVMVDIGANGRAGDARVWNTMRFNEMWAINRFPIPPPACLPGSTTTMRHFLIGDGGFPLMDGVMVPYTYTRLGQASDDSYKKFNKALSRARQCVECTFALLHARFGIIRKALDCDEANAPKIIKAMCSLHNFIQETGCTDNPNCVAPLPEWGMAAMAEAEWLPGTRTGVAERQRHMLREWVNSRVAI